MDIRILVTGDRFWTCPKLAKSIVRRLTPDRDRQAERSVTARRLPVSNSQESYSPLYRTPFTTVFLTWTVLPMFAIPVALFTIAPPAPGSRIVE